LSVLPDMLVRYKKLIDEGYRSSFGEGMALELSTAKAANARVSAEQIELRRGEVRARGQKQ
jgi:enoyl-CoA hydratase